MKTVNYGEKYTHRVTLRLNDEQYNYLIDISKILGVSPSDYMRMVINATLMTDKKGYEDVLEEKQKEGMVGTNENVKTSIDNIV